MVHIDIGVNNTKMCIVKTYIYIYIYTYIYRERRVSVYIYIYIYYQETYACNNYSKPQGPEKHLGHDLVKTDHKIRF